MLLSPKKTCTQVSYTPSSRRGDHHDETVEALTAAFRREFRQSLYYQYSGPWSCRDVAVGWPTELIHAESSVSPQGAQVAPALGDAHARQY